MRKFIFLLPLLLQLCSLQMFAMENSVNYTPLDKSHPISFNNNRIHYQDQEILLNEKNFFIDGQLSDADVANNPFVFNSVNEALKHITNGSEAEPMTLHIAPYVYWIDNPDDPTVHKPITGAIPYGQIVKCDWLRFHGLTTDPQNVVLASRRGQTQGAEGNFTMFYFDGDGISSENVTFGNYCNVDLVFPLLPQLNREKRSATVTQAQLIICNSDKVVARNTHFISRLNLCPFTGAKRIIFDKCYFESTDDALCSTGLYLDCKFTFFSSKPFFNTQGTGAVFLNCDFDVLTENRQYLTKAGSPVTIVDSRFKNSSAPLYIGWTQDPSDDLRCYQYNVSLNGKPIRINSEKPEVTVDMTGKKVLKAYQIEHNGQVIYNTYNLLRGNDDWDPMGVKEHILEVEKQTGENLTNIPTYIKISPASTDIESGVTTATLKAEVKRFGNYPLKGQKINWAVQPKYAALVTIAPASQEAQSVQDICEVKGINENDETKQAIVETTTEWGIESASALTVSPKFVEPPHFTSLPRIKTAEKGKLNVNYTIDLGHRKDESLITWYRCKDAKGSEPVEVSVSRLNQPEYTYQLSRDDVGYYIMASVAPKHLRCHPGKAESVVTKKAITSKDIIESHTLYTHFRNFSTAYQPLIIPGFWTVDGYKPLDLGQYDWEPPTQNAWYYGKGIDGTKGTGLVQVAKGARILYTPVAGTYKDMSITLNVDPAKQAGQGFGSPTGQYLEVYIKYDPLTLTGYGLRIIRTTKFDSAVDFVLMKYENGVPTPISDPVSATCYRTDCTISLKTQGNKLVAHVETTTPLPEPTHPNLKKTVDLEADIQTNTFGGTGVQHTGSTGASATMLHWLQVDWK